MWFRLFIIVLVLAAVVFILEKISGRKPRQALIAGFICFASLVVGSDPTQLGLYEGNAFMVFMISIPIAFASGIIFLARGFQWFIERVRARGNGGTSMPLS